MWRRFKNLIKAILAYSPLSETVDVRCAVGAVRTDGAPFTPDYEGDLLYSLIRKGGFKSCLETGFYTGSTALYMLAAVKDRNGSVTSIALDDDAILDRGRKLLNDAGFGAAHHLIKENSNRTLPELFLSSRRFDLIHMDGWKTYCRCSHRMHRPRHRIEAYARHSCHIHHWLGVRMADSATNVRSFQSLNPIHPGYLVTTSKTQKTACRRAFSNDRKEGNSKEKQSFPRRLKSTKNNSLFLLKKLASPTGLEPVFPP